MEATCPAVALCGSGQPWDLPATVSCWRRLVFLHEPLIFSQISESDSWGPVSSGGQRYFFSKFQFGLRELEACVVLVTREPDPSVRKQTPSLVHGPQLASGHVLAEKLVQFLWFPSSQRTWTNLRKGGSMVYGWRQGLETSSSMNTYP